MNTASARRVSALLQDVYRDLNEVLLVVQEREPGELQRLRDATSKVLLLILTEILNPIYAEHPELSPPELRRFFQKRKGPTPRKKQSVRSGRSGLPAKSHRRGTTVGAK